MLLQRPLQLPLTPPSQCPAEHGAAQTRIGIWRGGVGGEWDGNGAVGAACSLRPKGWGALVVLWVCSQTGVGVTGQAGDGSRRSSGWSSPPALGREMLLGGAGEEGCG